MKRIGFTAIRGGTTETKGESWDRRINACKGFDRKDFDAVFGMKQKIGLALGAGGAKGLAHVICSPTCASWGEITGGPPPFGKRDRSTFLQGLDKAVNDIRHKHS